MQEFPAPWSRPLARQLQRALTVAALALGSTLGAPGCAKQDAAFVDDAPRGLSLSQRLRAAERGRLFRDPAGQGPRDHRFERVDGPGGPRIHADSHTSIFILAGRATILIDGRPVELRPGQSVDVPAGRWYSASTVGPAGSLYYVFADKDAPLAKIDAPEPAPARVY